MSKVEEMLRQIQKEKDSYYQYARRMSGDEYEHQRRSWFEAARYRILQIVREIPAAMMHEHSQIKEDYRRGIRPIGDVVEYEKKYPVNDRLKLDQFLSDLANLNL